jgi:hypothetical protein
MCVFNNVVYMKDTKLYQSYWQSNVFKVLSIYI